MRECGRRCKRGACARASRLRGHAGCAAKLQAVANDLPVLSTPELLFTGPPTAIALAETMPRARHEMTAEKEREIRESAKKGLTQKKFDEVAAVVQEVVDEKGRAEILADTNVLLEAYEHWQDRVRQLLDQCKQFHQWPLIRSEHVCYYLRELKEKLEGVRHDPAAMAALLVSQKCLLPFRHELVSDSTSILVCFGLGSGVLYKRDAVDHD